MSHTLGTAAVAEINLPVALPVWPMIVPMLLKVDLAALGQVKDIGVTSRRRVGINWLVKPFSMAAARH
jgi:ACR3 family arsenite transporter